MSLRLIIFDLDGTLIDSVVDITNALNHVLLPYAHSLLSPGQVSGMIGNGVMKLVRRALQAHSLEVDPVPLTKQLLERYASRLTENTTLYPHAAETLAALADRRMALISNKSESLSRRILEKFGLTGYFSLVIGEETLPERKPSPAPILHALASLGIEPHEAIMVGDSEVDVAAGTAAGVRTVAVIHGYGGPGFQESADFVIPGLLPLAALVKSLP
jgi:phosphoglycolate phosphatase